MNYRKYVFKDMVYAPKFSIDIYNIWMYFFAKLPIGLILYFYIYIYIAITPKKNGFELWIYDMSKRV